MEIISMQNKYSRHIFNEKKNGYKIDWAFASLHRSKYFNVFNNFLLV